MSVWSDCEAREACRLLGAYTANRFDVWILAGPSKAGCRSHVMSALMGQRMPQSKSGVNAIRAELYRRLAIEGNCLAVQEKNFIRLCREEFGQPDANCGGSVLSLMR